MVSIATFLLLKKNYSKINIILNFISVIFLLSSGWPHGVIGYAVFVGITLVFEFKQSGKLNKVVYLSIPAILALIFSFPIYSEYIFSHDLTNRVNGFDSSLRTFIPSWSTIILGFFPTFYDYMTYISYRLVLVPLGFSTLFLPMVFFYRNIKELWQRDNILKWFSTLIIIFFLLSQMPSQFGPLRWPFRFLPFISFFICLAVFYILQYAHIIQGKKIILNKKIYISLYIILGGFFLFLPAYAGFDTLTLILSLVLMLFLLEHDLFNFKKSILVNFNKKYFLVILFVFCLVFFNSWNLHPFYIVLQIFSVWLLILSPKIIERKSSYGMIGLTLLILLLFLNGLPTLGGSYQRQTELAERIQLPDNVNLQGYVLSLPLNIYLKQTRQLNDIASAQFGFYDIKSINGYSPVGSKRLEKILPVNQSAHGIFTSKPALENILQSAKGFNVCQAVLMRISTIIVNKDDYAAFSHQFKQCGYSEVQSADSRSDLYVSLPFTLTKGWENNSPFVYPDIAGVRIVKHENNTDWVQIPEHKDNITLIFPRLWWYGYSANINDHILSVTADSSGSLVQVSVPSDFNGVLRLSYFPVTWRYLWFLPILAIMGLITLLFFNGKVKERLKLELKIF
ncbi:YfhO family protein [Snodgrassella alvi]|uniref:YfhO family protein n=1 Tax=Snodgrassella alvi TaxID=1196083 RepID=UPI001186BD5A|nr:YfhO family protein [Snodgrassella alvi]